MAHYASLGSVSNNFSGSSTSSTLLPNTTNNSSISLIHSLSYYYETFVFETRLLLISVMFNMGQLWKEINWKLFGKKVLGFEEALEEGAKKSIEEQLGFKLEVDE